MRILLMWGVILLVSLGSHFGLPALLGLWTAEVVPQDAEASLSIARPILDGVTPGFLFVFRWIIPLGFVLLGLKESIEFLARSQKQGRDSRS